MLTVRSKWRLLALMLPVALVIAAVAIFMGGSTNNQDSAFAGPPVDNSGVTCADVWLAALDEAPTDDLPTAIGNPPPLSFANFLAATSLTTTFHNTTENQYFTGPVNATNGVGVVVSTAIPGVIAGLSDGVVPLCASIDKVVATVTSVTSEPSGEGADITATVVVSATENNGPLPGMVVFWDSDNDPDLDRNGYYVVTEVDELTVELRATLNLCNGTPVDGSTLGSLHACTPENKGFDPPPFAHNNTNTAVGGILDPTTPNRTAGVVACAGGGSPPAEACVSEFRPADDCTGTAGEGCTVSITCAPATGQPANPLDPLAQWTRTEIRTTSYGGDESDKTPSYGVTVFYGPVDPNTCANNENTQRSITYNVVWPLDGVSLNPPVGANADPVADGWDSDWDKDGCLDWEELAQPQPVSVDADGGGRDAYNPYDCARTIDGVWSITARARAIELDGGKDLIPGSWFRCRASIELPDVRIYCYRDDEGVEINIEVDAAEFGDGIDGSIWPTGSGGLPPAADGPYGDVNEAHDVLTAAYNSGTDTLSLSGCLEDKDGANPEGNVYWSTESGTGISVLQGYGEVDIWLDQTLSDCTGDNPQGAPDYADAGLFVGIQGDFSVGYDQDLDGNPNSRELQDDPGCGLRDPFNRYDYYDVSVPKDGVIDLANDILGVITHFSPGGYVGFVNWDRPPAMLGSDNSHNRGAPDGVIDLANDILGVILQFNPGGCGLG